MIQRDGLFKSIKNLSRQALTHVLGKILTLNRLVMVALDWPRRYLRRNGLDFYDYCIEGLLLVSSRDSTHAISVEILRPMWLVSFPLVVI
jgi:hypothetical protein